MKSKDTVQARINDDGVVVRILEDGSESALETKRTDWDRVAQMSDEDVEYNALMDPDFEPFLTDQDRAVIARLPDPKVIRTRLKLTQMEFSRRFEIPLGTLRDWERRARFPDSAARAYLRVISEDPEAVAALLHRSSSRIRTEPAIA